MQQTDSTENITANITAGKWRDSSQPLLPVRLEQHGETEPVYEHFPHFAVGEGQIFRGFDTLADWAAGHPRLIMDGYAGVFYDEVRHALGLHFAEKGLKVNWHDVRDHLKAEALLDELISPFLGSATDVWGTRTDLELRDFYESSLTSVVPGSGADLDIVIGPGAALCGWDVPVIYVELPKNELQYRMRAGSVTNLGKTRSETATAMYKRFYFVDWVVLDRHRSTLLDRIHVFADAQQGDDISWMPATGLREALSRLGHSAFRARPWFEKGSWGGQWMKEHLRGINTDEVNYAWSFELITPENGVVLESDGNLLELSFDLMMQYEYKNVLGKHAGLFGPYFPIRFDFLDTFDGGNLSIQCHPSTNYIRKHFGEQITQDETYYILDCKPGAKVYLGFQEDIDPVAFRAALEDSQARNEPLDVTRYVQEFPSRKHELFLIPNGTVHSSGKNNMVLEISATPYIFTFKMYDWLSLDLNGKPRPINIAHAFNNLRFERKGSVVREQHISRQEVTARGSDWELVSLSTHPDHFYAVERMEFDTEVDNQTNNACHVLMLVEGTSVGVAVAGQPVQRYHYAETFIVPAAAGSYKLLNYGAGRAKVVRSFVKDGYGI